MKAYYFATPARRLQYGDGRVITVGATHKVAGPLKLCANGLHASMTPFEALRYAPGPLLYLVRLSGAIMQGDDKCAASERTYLAEYDATELLRSYARWCALRHIDKVKPYCSANNYATVVAYLNTGDEALREAASEAVRAAIWAASEAARAADVAEAASWAAVWAARAAVWATSRATRATRDAGATSLAAGAAWAARAAADASELAAELTAAWVAWAAERAVLADKFNSMVAEATGWEV